MTSRMKSTKIAPVVVHTLQPASTPFPTYAIRIFLPSGCFESAYTHSLWEGGAARMVICPRREAIGRPPNGYGSAFGFTS